ncbi:hypothetical protein [Filifactor alocis]|uniref:hypothetical protein n=1 Tax=Filifactor alocis TaxID=143361 RepID=UPI0028E1A61F|nr:hypothetical protein [Filifactor alocis]
MKRRTNDVIGFLFVRESVWMKKCIRDRWNRIIIVKKLCIGKVMIKIRQKENIDVAENI